MQYTLPTNSYTIISQSASLKAVPQPTPLNLPSNSDVTNEFDGETQQILMGHTTPFTGNFLQQATLAINNNSAIDPA